MKDQKRLRDYGIIIGKGQPGALNAISDVRGVTVGHVTLDNNQVKTGVTAILPHQGNLFREKVFGSVHIINGFGKSIGLVQIQEMGTIETPIILTNTLCTGIACDAIYDYMLNRNTDIGITTGTVNPIICECNDYYLNDIRSKNITKEHVLKSIANASSDFLEGAVGAGTGMSCYGLNGGIGTASRIVHLNNCKYTIGALVLTNMGCLNELRVDGMQIHTKMDDSKTIEQKIDYGSIIIILATDIPMVQRQLKRMSKRAIVGLSRTGSYIDNGSGEIVISFCTSNKFNHYEKDSIIQIGMVNENQMDIIFRMVSEVVEESILNSMVCADDMIGTSNHVRKSLKNYL